MLEIIFMLKQISNVSKNNFMLVNRLVDLLQKAYYCCLRDIK